MHSPVITLTSRESAAHLSHLLLETSHGGFPVVKWHEESRQEVAYGLITRWIISFIIYCYLIIRCTWHSQEDSHYDNVIFTFISWAAKWLNNYCIEGVNACVCMCIFVCMCLSVRDTIQGTFLLRHPVCIYFSRLSTVVESLACNRCTYGYECISELSCV